MSSPVTAVTEGRMTITANDTEDNIRAAAGFAPAEAKPDAPKVDKDEAKVDNTDAEASADDAERNPDGTFKAKEKPEAEKADEKPVKADGDPRKSHQAKINQAIAKQRDAERRAEEAERRLAQREAEWNQPRQAPQPQTQAPSVHLQTVQRYQSLPDAPKLEEFAGLDDPYAAYQVAIGAFIADKRLAEYQAQESATRAQREREQHVARTFDLAEQNHPGLREQILTDTRQYPPAVLQLLAVESAQDPAFSAELLHHLVTHPDDAAQLARCEHPIAAARELGRISERLSSASSGPETVATQTNAKPLIKPVGASVSARESSSPDDLPFSKYMQVMNERDRKAREARGA